MYTERVSKYLNENIGKWGYSLDSVTFTREAGINYLRAFIYRTDGEDMTVEDCAKVSRPLSKWLDREDFISEEYILEVCSLGFKENPGNEDIEAGDGFSEEMEGSDDFRVSDLESERF